MRFCVARGNNEELIRQFFSREMLELFADGSRGVLMEKVRCRWTNKPLEREFEHFVEGKHVVNHFKNSDQLTEK